MNRVSAAENDLGAIGGRLQLQQHASDHSRGCSAYSHCNGFGERKAMLVVVDIDIESVPVGIIFVPAPWLIHSPEWFGMRG